VQLGVLLGQANSLDTTSYVDNELTVSCIRDTTGSRFIIVADSC
jgi:hypothetical protein